MHWETSSVPDVHIHYARPEEWEDQAVAEASVVLSSAELDRASRFRFERDRKLYLVSHIVLRRVLASALQAHPRELEFTQNSYGRPLLAGSLQNRLHFSLAHCHGLAVCAALPTHDLGVDVEPIERALPTGVAERCFCPEELGDLHRFPEDQRAARFFEYWTLKEAYAKARGIGISLPLEKIRFRLTAAGVVFAPDAEVEAQPKSWSFRSILLPPSHRVALAVRTDSLSAVHLRSLSAFDSPDRSA